MPGAEQMRAAGSDSVMPRFRVNWKLSLATLPGVGAGLLTKLACPVCWPAYAGLLSSLGLGFLLETRYLLPITVLFLALALATLAFRARQRRGYRPFGLGLLASAAVLSASFVLHSDLTMYAGLAALIGASVWNSWPIDNSIDTEQCPSCAVVTATPASTAKE